MLTYSAPGIASSIFSALNTLQEHFCWSVHYTQVYLSSPASDAATAVDRLSACVADVNDWMMASRLRLNPSKTQVMWLGSSQQLDKINIRDVPLLSASITVINTARDFGVILDSQLSLDAHVASVCRSS